MVSCPYCGCEEAQYVGIDAGGGDFGTSLCDVYRCIACDETYDVNCYDLYDDPEEIDQDVQ